MKIKNDSQFLVSAGVVLAGMFVAFIITVKAQADLLQVEYPVAELGNCGSEEECRSFCNDGGNLLACVSFAERNNLMSPKEATEARKFARLGGEGPGGCTDKIQCIEYCEDVAHIDECVAFAEENGFIDEEELAEAKRVAAALKGGASLPGDCRSKAECETYCDNLDHIGECFDFASKSGLIPEEELDEARKAVEVIKKGDRPPGGCKNKTQCEEFCSDPNNMEECFAFAEKAGFIPPEEIEQARKVIPLMKAGKMPGGCKSKVECEAYCEDEANMDVCANFAIEAGFMKPEEAEMFRKTGGKGPGGCRGRGQCENFCNDPANQEVCFSFATEHNLIPLEEMEQIQEGFQQFRQGMESAPPEVSECLRSSLGGKTFDKLQSGQTMPGPQMGKTMRSCFEDFARSQFEGGEGQGFGPPGDFEGERPEGSEQFGGREGFVPPEGLSPEEFERFREKGGFPGGEGGSFPSKEEMEKFQRDGFDEGMEELRQGGFEGMPPSPEDIQSMIQERTGDAIRQRTQEIIQQRTQEQFERFGPQGSQPGLDGGQQFFGQPSGEGSFGPSGGSPSPNPESSGGGFGPAPSEFNQQPSSGGFEQFAPPPSGGDQSPPPTSSAFDVILKPFLNLVR